MDVGQWTRAALPVVVSFSVSLSMVGCSTTPETAAALEPEPIDLSGEWVLNHELSDSPSDVLKLSSNGNTAKSIFQTVGGAISVYGISARDVVGMLPAGEEEPPEYHAHVTDSRLILSVLQFEDSVEVKYDQAGTEVYRNGETVREEEELIFSEWDGYAYIVERQPEAALPITEIFELDVNRVHLYWTIVVENAKGKEVTIKRVYDVMPEDTAGG